MKRFDTLAVLTRMINQLQSKDQWSNIQKDGATYQLLEALSESPSEIARYGEQLLRELKWDTSRNFSSTKHMAKLVGKKLDRKHSAVGTIVVSHSDLEGSPRYSYIGTENFDIDAESNYDNRELDTSLSDIQYSRALTPWLDTNSYTVPLHAVCYTKTGIEYVCAEKKEIQIWQNYWRDINKTEANRNSFRAAGGWNNYKYLLVPVVQGIEKTVTLGTSDNTASQSFLLATLDVEAADSYYTSQFCYIEIEGDDEHWEEIQHLQTAQSTDKVFEINILDDLSGTEIKFGDGINGAIPPKDLRIVFHYLETKGAEGNLYKLYSFANEISGVQLPQNTKYRGLTVGCQNVWPITGGKDLENLADFKENAETAYAKNYKILHTYSELLDRINTISPIPLIKTQVKTFYEETKINSTKVYKNTIGITGLSTSLHPLTDVEQIIFEKTVNNCINSKVLSNKIIKYVTPPILEIDSYISLEFKNPIQNIEGFKSSLKEYLQSKLGKTNLDALDCYMQADPIRESLEYSNNIGAISAVNLFTFSTNAISFGVDKSTDSSLIAFEFDLPVLTQDNTSREGYCDKALADGNEVCYIFNLKIANTETTLVVIENESTVYPNIINYEKDSSFPTEDVLSLPVYDTTNNVTKVKYDVKQLLNAKHTFSREELANINNLKFNTTDENFEKVYFYASRSENSLSLTLVLDAESLGKQLGYTKISTEKVYSALKSSIQNNYCSVTASFEPVDKTVTGDWNTIFYYNNIDVEC